jgi:CheY-like chemotaxis protein
VASFFFVAVGLLLAEKSSRARQRDFTRKGYPVKIIVVDDEPIIADTLVNILEGEGHDALAVCHEESAIKWAKMVRPDAIISDVMMPGMNGIEAAKAILEELPNCRIILFSGQAASSDLLAKARADGYIFEVLAKPKIGKAMKKRWAERKKKAAAQSASK